MLKKSFSKIPKSVAFLSVESFDYFIANRLRLHLRYDAQKLCVGVIFACKQDGRTIFSKFDFFVFLRVRFVTHHNSNCIPPIQWVLKYNFSN